MGLASLHNGGHRTSTILRRALAWFLLFSVLLSACGGAATPAPAVVEAPAATVTPSALPAATATPSPTATSTPEPTLALPVQQGTPAPTPAGAFKPGKDANLAQLARWGKGVLYHAVLSPDGATLALATPTGVYLHDAITLAEKGRLIPGDRPAVRLLFSPDGSWLAVADDYHQVHLYSFGEERWLVTLPGERYGGDQRASAFFDFAPDGKSLALVGTNQVTAYSLPDGKQTWQEQVDDAQTSSTLYYTLDGQRLLLVSRETVVFLNALEGQETGRQKAEYIEGHTLSPDRKILAVMRARYVPSSMKSESETLLFDTGSGTVARRIAFAQFQTAFSTGDNQAKGMAVSPDSKMLALAYSNGPVCLWDLEKNVVMQCLAYVKNSEYDRGVSFSGDGRWLYSYSERTFARWDVATWNQVERFETGEVRQVLYPANAEMVLTVQHSPSTEGAVGQIVSWNLQPKALLSFDAGGVLRDLAYTPDGQLLVAASDQGVSLWQAADGSPVKTLPGEALAMHISPSGKLLAVAQADNSIQLYGLPDGEAQRKLSGQQGRITALFFMPGDEILVSTSAEQTLMWNLSDGTALPALQDAADVLLALPGSQGVFTLMRDLDMAMWDGASGKSLGRNARLKGRREDLLAAGFWHGNAYVLNADSLSEVNLQYGVLGWKLAVQPGKAPRVRVSPSGDTLAVSVAGGIQFFDLYAHTLGKMEGEASAFVFDPRQDHLAVARDRQVSVWPANGKASQMIGGFGSQDYASSLAYLPHSGSGFTKELGADRGPVLLLAYSNHMDWFDPQSGVKLAGAGLEADCMAVSGDGKWFAVLRRDNEYRPVLVMGDSSKDSGQPANPTNKQLHTCQSLAISASGRLAAMLYGNETAEIEIWDAATASSLGSFPVSKTASRAAISPDGNLLVYGHQSEKGFEPLLSIVDIHDPRQAKPVETLNLKETFSFWTRFDSMTFSPDGAWLAAGTPDGSILLLSTADWLIEAKLQGHTDAVDSLAFTPDGQTLFSSSRDGTLRVWGTSSRPDAFPTPEPLVQREATSIVETIVEPTALPLKAVDPAGLAQLDAANLKQLIELNRWQVGKRTESGGCSGCAFYSWPVPAGSSVAASEDGQPWVGLGIFSGETEGLSLLQPFSDQGVRRKGMAWGDPPPSWVAISPDGKTLASASLKLPVIRLHKPGGQEVRQLEGHSLKSGLGVVFTPDGRYLVSAATDLKDDTSSELIVWDLQKDGERKATVKVDAGRVRTMVVQSEANGEYVLLVGVGRGNQGPALQRFRLTADGALQAIDRVGDFTAPGVTALALSPDGKHLAVALVGGAWRVVDAVTLKDEVLIPAETFPAVQGKPPVAVTILSMTFLPGGNGLLVTYFDGSVRLWGVQAH